MEIQNNLNQCTPPKNNKRVTFSTPPHKENPQTNPKILGYLKRSAGKFNVNVSSFQSISSRQQQTIIQIEQQVHPFKISRLDQDYDFIKCLGRGNFSSVSLYKSKVSGQKFAIKQNKTSSMSVNEIQALASLSLFAENCKHIIRYYHSWIQEQCIYMVMEYCQTNLASQYNNRKRAKKRMSETQLIKIAKQILMALKYLHEHNMVHLDLKPDNILFSDEILKLADLGLCRLARVKKWMELTQGDSRYLAKQILNYNNQTDLTKADIFSLGITLYEGVTFQNLPNNGQRWHYLRQGVKISKRQDLRKYYSQNFLKLIQSMMEFNPMMRQSAKNILQNPLFKQNTRKNILLNSNSKRQKNDTERSL